MNQRPLIGAGTLLGIGMGGFLDGILFHQILQIHNMLSAIRPKTTLVNAEINMFWDGLFHAFTWLATALGVTALFHSAKQPDVPWSGRTLIGSAILGWGIFNFVEGTIDHHILGVHHVVEELGVSIFDYAFLGSGVLFIVVGWRMIQTAHATGSPEQTAPGYRAQEGL